MKTKLPLIQAQQIAERMVDALKPYCQRIEIAGSVRRGKPEVGDIELVAMPIPETDMFLHTSYEPHMLDGVKWELFGKLIKGGSKYKQVELNEGINLDLFIVTPPAQWGVIFLIRTGSSDFSHRFVTHKQQGGLLPGYLNVKDGAIWSHNHIIETPEEIDVFNLCGVRYVTPELRIE